MARPCRSDTGLWPRGWAVYFVTRLLSGSGSTRPTGQDSLGIIAPRLGYTVVYPTAMAVSETPVSW